VRGAPSGRGTGAATYSIFGREIELESDDISSSGSLRALRNDRRIETARVTMKKIMSKREDLAMRAGESEKGWGVR
jgi:hypothetical protein